MKQLISEFEKILKAASIDQGLKNLKPMVYQRIINMVTHIHAAMIKPI